MASASRPKGDRKAETPILKDDAQFVSIAGQQPFPVNKDMRIRSAASFLVSAVTAFLLAVSCGSPRAPSATSRVDRLFTQWDRADSPGCGVGVSRNRDVIFERGYGMASLERNDPIGPSTVFHLASITKAFTAMSVLLAAEQSLLSLDDDVSKYIPDWSVAGYRVTIRHLLTHTSGVRDAYLLQGWAPENGNSKDDLLRILARQRALNFAPGAEYQYNNGGYLLLGEILEQASGESLGAFADANIFNPVGMKSAWFNGDPVREAPAGQASGYSPQANGWRLLSPSSGYAGNAGMMASVRDLLLWANHFADGRIGTPARLMQAPTVLTGGATTQSGMGLVIGNYRGARTLRTSGGDFGAATELVLYPDQKLTIVVLCNMDSVVMGGLATVNVTELTNGLADILFDDVLEPLAPSATAQTPPSPVSLSADELASKTGLYRLGSDENHIVMMSLRDGSLTAWDFWGDNYAMLMTPIGSNRFVIPGITLEFSPAESGRPQSWHVIDTGGQRLLDLPLVQYDASDADLESFSGEYRSDELDVAYSVAVRDSSLVMESSTLHPVSEDAFVGDYLGVVRFLRDARDAVSGFTLNRSGARGVRFERTSQAGG